MWFFLILNSSMMEIYLTSRNQCQAQILHVNQNQIIWSIIMWMEYFQACFKKCEDHSAHSGGWLLRQTIFHFYISWNYGCHFVLKNSATMFLSKLSIFKHNKWCKVLLSFLYSNENNTFIGTARFICLARKMMEIDVSLFSLRIEKTTREPPYYHFSIQPSLIGMLSITIPYTFSRQRVAPAAAVVVLLRQQQQHRGVVQQPH